MAVSPLNALISDQVESFQRLKLKAVEMEQELFDNDDTLKEVEEAEVLYCSLEILENIRSRWFFLRMDDQLIGIVLDKSHSVAAGRPNLGLSICFLHSSERCYFRHV